MAKKKTTIGETPFVECPSCGKSVPMLNGEECACVLCRAPLPLLKTVLPPKTPDGKYYYGYHYKLDKDGKKIEGTMQKKYGKTLNEYYRKAKEYETSPLRGKNFKQAGEEWRASPEYAALTVNTQHCYETPYRRLVEEFQDYGLNEITIDMVEEHFEKLITLDGKKRTFKTLKDSRTVINNIYRYHNKPENRKNGELIKGYSPCDGYKIDKSKCKPSEKRPFPTNDDIKQIVLSKDGKDIVGAFFFTALVTGTRYGELVAIRKKDINFSKMEITIEQAFVPRNKSFGDPKDNAHRGKGSKTRIVDMPIALANVLRPLIKSLDPESCVFACLQSTSVYKKLAAFNEKHGTNVKPHMLRHGFASFGKAAGIDSMVLAEMMGHENDTVTKQVYIHMDKVDQRHKSKELTEYIDQFIMDTVTENKDKVVSISTAT